jgi:hypothetical protein
MSYEKNAQQIINLTLFYRPWIAEKSNVDGNKNTVYK